VKVNPFIALGCWRSFFMVTAIGAPLGIYFAGMGGTGLNLPFNSLIYACTAGVIFFIWLPMRKTVMITVPFLYFLVGGIVLNIPLLYADQEVHESALWRALALLAGAGLYFSWLQLKLPFRQRRGALYAVLLLVGIQALIALLQIFAPALSWVPTRGGRVFGSFLQPNVLGSFIATGLASLLMLFLMPGYVWRRYERLRTALLALGLLIFPALLVWIQSRAAWLGAGVAVILFFCLFGRHSPRRSMAAGTLAVVGALLGLGVMLWAAGNEGQTLRYISHDGSTVARLSMLHDTLAMIAEKPLLGWGYGGFEYHFQHFRIAQIPPTVVTEIARHPHNEILLWWVEGGMVALVGMGIMLAGGVRLLVQVIRCDRKAQVVGERSAGEGSALCLVLIPMLVHSQLEYPFSLSAIHWLLFLLLLATVDRLSCGAQHRRALPGPSGVIFSNILRLLAVFGAVVMLATFQGGRILTQAERSGMKEMEAVDAMSPLTALAHRERREFDQQTHALLVYNHTQDEILLNKYVSWAQGYLKRRIDNNVYASLIIILRYHGDIQSAEKYRQNAGLIFPEDPRFVVPKK